ncbi:MAG: carbohydrate kinase, partial [Anaerolineae bacterium]|nr:carbohydrate kinase [Anaerolineae bacterium]
MNNPLILVHDIGTTSSKSCLYRIGERLEILATALEEYPLYVLDNGGVEQDPELWWS